MNKITLNSKMKRLLDEKIKTSKSLAGTLNRKSMQNVAETKATNLFSKGLNKKAGVIDTTAKGFMKNGPSKFTRASSASRKFGQQPAKKPMLTFKGVANAAKVVGGGTVGGAGLYAMGQ